MAISFNRYIDITSGVGGGGAVKSRDLITRIFTSNPLVPSKSFIEFSDPADVEALFGSSSEEYLRAASYFSFVSKQITSPDKISFARWTNAAIKPSAVGDPAATDNVGTFLAFSGDTLPITIGNVNASLADLVFTGATTLTNIATIIQTALVAVAGLAGSTVVFNTETGAFIITGPTAGSAAGTISFPAAFPDLAVLLGMRGANTVITAGADAETITNTLTNSVNASSNFATFLFTTAAALDQAQIVEALTWNGTQGVNFMYLIPVLGANAAAYSEAMLGLEGGAITLAPVSTEYPEMLPGKVLAATNYANRNAVQNYEFQQDGTLTASVTDDADANTYDGLSVNYYGQTQVNGQKISFYQTGVLTGGATAPTDMGDYANEIWFRGDIGNYFMSALLGLGQIPANNAGRAICSGIIQQAINDALFNGVISVGNALTVTQINFINNISGDTTASKQVSTIGYWFTVSFTSSVNDNGVTVWQANYIIIYAKNNSIRKVVGSHILI